MKFSSHKVQIDEIDKIIINGLIANARVSIVELSKRTGISSAAVHQRLKKLEDSGLINGSHININPKIIGYTTLAFVGIFLDKAMNNPEAVAQLKNIPEVIECHYTTGNWSVFIKILCKDNEHLMTLLNTKIQSIKGISRTETFISLNQQINRQIHLN